MTERQFSRNSAVRQQPLRAIEVVEQRVEQACTLNHARLDLAPLGGGQQDRQRIEYPGAIASLRIRIHIVSYAVLDDQSARQVHAAAHGGRIIARQASDQRLPVLANVSRAIEQFVVPTGIAHIRFKARRGHLSLCVNRA